MKHTRILKALAVILAISLGMALLVGCNDDEELHEVSDSTMKYLDTEIQIILYTDDTEKGEELIDAAFDEIARLEGILSRHVEGSDIMKINEKAGESEVDVNPETVELIEEAKEWGEKTEGHFDITIAPLMNRWGFDPDRTYEKIGDGGNEDSEIDFELPTEEEIEELKELVDYTKIELDTEEETVFLPEEEMELETAGIAKGYVMEGVLELIQEEGIKHALVRAGGDMTTIGDKPGDEPWVIGIMNPRESGQFATYHLDDKSMGTAGDYMRYFELDGERYSHILDPIDGRPAKGIVSATVEASTAMEIDVISTTAFVKGKDKGLEFIENLEDVEGALVDEDGVVHYSSGFEDNMAADGPASGDKIF